MLELERTPENEIRLLQTSIYESNLRRAVQLTMAENFKLGADLYDDGIQWLRQIIKAERPGYNDEKVDMELDRRRAIVRRVEEQGYFRPVDDNNQLNKDL